MEKEVSSEIDGLKKEIVDLRNDSVATANIHVEISELKAAVEKLLTLFSTAIGYIKEDKATPQSNAPVLEKLDRLLDENTVIANGLVKITNLIEALNSRFDSMEVSIKEDSGFSLPVLRTPARANAKPTNRKEIFDRLKGSFSK